MLLILGVELSKETEQMAPSKDTIFNVDQLQALLAELIHELRTPLLTIKGLSKQIPESTEVKTAINKQVDKINTKLDETWSEIAPETSHTDRTLNFLNTDGEPSHQINFNAGKPLKLLIVDDDELIRKIASRIFEQQNYEVVCAPNGEVALNQILAHEFDVVFIDLNMKTISGMELAAAIHKVTDTQIRPTMIGMSNDPRSAEMRQKCLSAGMDTYMEKPLSIERCSQALQQLNLIKNQNPK